MQLLLCDSKKQSKDEASRAEVRPGANLLCYVPKRLGAYFSICGPGETTLQNEIADITIYNILKNGHYVNLTKDGTIGKRLKVIVEKAGGVCFASSFCFFTSLFSIETTWPSEYFF